MGAAQIIKCACGCGDMIGPDHIGAFRRACLVALGKEIIAMQKLSKGELAILADMFRCVGAVRHAEALAGNVPFDAGR